MKDWYTKNNSVKKTHFLQKKYMENLELSYIFYIFAHDDIIIISGELIHTALMLA